MSMKFNSQYDFFSYLYDKGLLSSFEISSDGGYGFLVDIFPTPPSEQIRELIEGICWNNLAHLTGSHQLTKNSNGELESKTFRCENVELWDNKREISRQIMETIATHLSLPNKLFRETNEFEPAVFVDLKMTYRDNKVEEFSVDYNWDDDTLNEMIEHFSLKPSTKEVSDILSKKHPANLSEAIKDYVFSFSFDFNPTGFFLVLEEYVIYQLEVNGEDEISLKDRLSKQEVIEAEDLGK